MADKWAGVRELEGQLASLIAEFDRSWWRPWRQPGIRRKALRVSAELKAAIDRVSREAPSAG